MTPQWLPHSDSRTAKVSALTYMSTSSLPRPE